MKIPINIGLLFVLTANIAFSQRSSAPPKVYISKGACPIECCTYRNWTAQQTLSLLDQPGGHSIAQIGNGEQVSAITGEIHTKPLRYQLTEDGPYADRNVPGKRSMIPAGSIVYLLHPVGEGYWLVWFKGKAIEIDPAYGGPPPPYQWWAKVKRRTGQTGWVLIPTEDLAFHNVDACS
jgi:hypothetical protein